MTTPNPPYGSGEEPRPSGSGQDRAGVPGPGDAAGAPAPSSGDAPWGATPPPAPGYGDQPQPGWGAPPAPSYGVQEPQQYGQYGAPGPAPTYAVSQPGIIPLRPLTFGELYDGAFKAIRSNPGVMFGLAAAVVAVVSLLQGVATFGMFERLNAIAGQPTADAADLDEIYDTMTATLGPLLVSTVVSFVVTTILNGVLIHSVSQSVIGRRLSVGELWTLVRPQLLRLLGLTLLIGIGLTIAVTLCLLPAVLASFGGDIGLVVGLVVLGALLALAALLFLVVITVLATPALVLERAGVLTALRRSWQLTRRAFWRVAGIYLLTSVLVGIVAQVVAQPVAMLAGLSGDLTVVTVATMIGATLATALTTPFMAAVIALLYVDIRIRYEGLDVELAAAASASDG